MITRSGQLRMLSAPVVLVAAGCLVWASSALTMPTQQWQLLYPLVAAALIAVGSACSAPVPVRSSARLNSTPTAILVSAVVLPPAWVVICTALGVATAKLITPHRSSAVHKGVHNTAKDIIAATCAGLVVQAVGAGPLLGAGGLRDAWASYLIGLACAAAAVVVIDELLTTTMVAVATGRGWWQVARTAWDIRMAIALALDSARR